MRHTLPMPCPHSVDNRHKGEYKVVIGWNKRLLTNVMVTNR